MTAPTPKAFDVVTSSISQCGRKAKVANAALARHYVANRLTSQ